MYGVVCRLWVGFYRRATKFNGSVESQPKAKLSPTLESWSIEGLLIQESSKVWKQCNYLGN